MRSFSLFAATPTPFDARGRYQPNLIPPFVEYLCSQPLDGVYVGGTTGEALFQTPQERAAVLADFAKAVGNRLQLYANVGGVATCHAIELAEAAATCGYRAVGIMPPSVYDLSARQIFTYYATVAEASALPLIVYYFPAHSGRILPVELFQELLQIDNIEGVKFTASDFYLFDRLKAAAPQKQLFYGQDENLLAALPYGPTGAIGSTYNLISPLYRETVDAFGAGDMMSAAASQRRTNDVVQHLLGLGVVPGLKLALKSLGLNMGSVRAPLSDADKAAASTFLSVLDAVTDSHASAGQAAE